MKSTREPEDTLKPEVLNGAIFLNVDEAVLILDALDGDGDVQSLVKYLNTTQIQSLLLMCL